MKKVSTLLMLLALLLSCPFGRGQEKATPSSEKPRPIIPVKLTLLLTEFDGEKKVASLPYSILVNSDPSGHVAYRHVGEGSDDEIEQRVRQLLGKPQGT